MFEIIYKEKEVQGCMLEVVKGRKNKPALSYPPGEPSSIRPKPADPIVGVQDICPEPMWWKEFMPLTPQTNEPAEQSAN